MEEMKKYLVKMRHDGVHFPMHRIYEAKNPSEAIVKANNENKEKGWIVIAVYEQIWHI